METAALLAVTLTAICLIAAGLFRLALWLFPNDPYDPCQFPDLCRRDDD